MLGFPEKKLILGSPPTPFFLFSFFSFLVDDPGLAFPSGQLCFSVYLSLFLLDLLCSQDATLVVALIRKLNLQKQSHRLHFKSNY